ncbi:CaiB/BaiF CoA transferase family protein [Ilumatobacter coccineus]|uniref:CaiB/BaiF family protein n=1 Tax=Ilumatobacter coccineus (strain NBRC 103263 / KCTC 29153 / YM16-304) TaxID=1313172 RepID=A0A6C7EAB8_ILUCY|nr:CoA transferase [Ilumatobacter coccineus]BAN02075.1 CaiB/BaiF family protein [Ilumatobacter coccineus YM16-304]
MSFPALTGIKVVDVTTTMLGPYCSLRLAEFGADVIKVEAPVGDVTRQGTGGSHQFTGTFLTVNAGKRSVVLDLKTEAGLQAIYRLASTADVFLHNMPRPTADRLGIGPDAIREKCPSIVYCAAYGYGEGGPYAGRPAYDDIMQALSGLAASQHSGDGGRPSYISSPVADKTVGLMAAFAIAAALVGRERNGVGVAIEVPMFEVMCSYALQERIGGSAFVPAKSPMQSRLASRFRRPYRTSDGYISVLVLTQVQWERFAALIGKPELLADERFENVDSRVRHSDEFFQYLDTVFVEGTTDEWLERLVGARIPAGRVNTLDDLLDDEHLRSVDFFQEIEHPSVGPTIRPRSGVRFDGLAHDLSPAPSLGEHTMEVLMGLGYTADDAAAVAAAELEQ